MHNIILKIKSLFEGEGFTKANSAIKDTASSASKAVAPVNQIGTALGQLEGPVGKGARAVTGFVNAVKTMGVIGGIVAAAQLAIKTASDKIVQHYNDMAEACKKAAATMRDKLQNQLNGILGDTETALKRVGSEADNDRKVMEALANSVNKVNAALGKRADAAAAADAAKLELEKMQALMGIENENVRKVTEAEWNYKIALESGKKAIEARAREEEDAATKVQQATDASNLALKNLTDARNALAKAEETVRDLESAPETDTTRDALNRARKNLTDAQDLVRKREAEQVDAEADLKVATIDLETQRLKTQEAEAKAAKAAADAADKRDQANREADENRRKEAEAAEKAKAAAEKKEAIAAAEQDAANALAQINGDLESAKAGLAQAEALQAQWEAEKKELDVNQFNKIQAANAEKLVAWVENHHSTKALTEQQKKVLAEYTRWKELMQDKNPYDEMVMKFQQEVNLKTSAMEEQQRISNENLYAIKNCLESALVLQ